MINVEIITYLGILPLGVLIGIAGVLTFSTVFRSGVAPRKRKALSYPDEAPLKSIELSTIRRERTLETEPDGYEPLFRTLEVTASGLPGAKWRLYVKFIFLNRHTTHQIFLEDIHTRLYYRRVPAPPVAAISYRGEVLLLQDNRIRKQTGPWSLNPVDGLESHGFAIDLVLEMTRLEGAPIYGPDHPEDGPVYVIFGLFVDYRHVSLDDVEPRRTVASDCLYLATQYTRGANLSFDYLQPEEDIEALMAHINPQQEMDALVAAVQNAWLRHQA